MSDKSEVDFKKLMNELDTIVEWFESEDVDLDQSLAKFERGMELAQQLKSHLTQVENKVKKIQSKFDES